MREPFPLIQEFVVLRRYYGRLALRKWNQASRALHRLFFGEPDCLTTTGLPSSIKTNPILYRKRPFKMTTTIAWLIYSLAFTGVMLVVWILVEAVDAAGDE